MDPRGSEADRHISGQDPYDLLQANPKLEILARSADDPKDSVAGRAKETERRIEFHGVLSFGTTAHELGHFISYSDKQLFKDFRDLSEWSYLDRDDLENEINDRKEREKLEKQLDRDYEKWQKDKNYDGEEFEHEDYIYRARLKKDREGEYVRRHKDACFISDYAKTSPGEDFAESFETMFVEPERLQKKCFNKYEFMLVRVLTEYRLNRQKATVLKAFDSIIDYDIEYGWGMEDEINDKYAKPLRAALVRALDTQRDLRVTVAESTVKTKPKPIPMDPKAEQLAEPHLAQVKKLAAVARPVVQRYAAFSKAAFEVSLFEIEPELDAAFTDIVERLELKMKDELMAVFDPVATRVLKGEDVDMSTWPEIDAIRDKYQKSVPLIKPYVPAYEESYKQWALVHSHAIKILVKVTDKARQKQIRSKLVTLANVDFKNEIMKWRADVVTRLRDGKPFDRKQVKSTTGLTEAYKKKMTKVARETK